MKHKIFKQYVVDAFTDQVFQGNPAAVCVLEAWPEDQVMQQIAQENRLSETAFTVKQGRSTACWFTLGKSTCVVMLPWVRLCAVPTLEKKATELVFVTKSGKLTVTRTGICFTLICRPMNQERACHQEYDGSQVEPKEAYMGRDLVCVLETAEQVKKPSRTEKVKKLDRLLLT